MQGGLFIGFVFPLYVSRSWVLGIHPHQVGIRARTSLVVKLKTFISIDSIKTPNIHLESTSINPHFCFLNYAHLSTLIGPQKTSK